MCNYEEADRLENEIKKLCQRRIIPCGNLEEVIDRSTQFIDLFNKLKVYKPNVRADPVFRGHSDTSFVLESTLFRQAGEFPVHNYYRNLSKTIPIVQTSFGGNYDLPIDYWRFGDPEIVREALSSPQKVENELPLLEYMVLTRHFGLPSPLLDWTRSIYVAAYFAYKGVNRDANRQSGQVAIFMHFNSISGGQFVGKQTGDIIRVHPYGKTNPRHYSQKAVYTVCVNVLPYPQNPPEGYVLQFMSHENVIKQTPSTVYEDVLIKYELPASDRQRVLRQLDNMNINDYTLFNTMESLMFWLSESEFEV